MLASAVGHDRHLVIKALMIAITAMDAVPERRRPRTDRESLTRLLRDLKPSDTEAQLYARAAEWILKEAVATIGSQPSSNMAGGMPPEHLSRADL